MIQAVVTARTIAGREALERTQARATDERIRTLRVVDAGLTLAGRSIVRRAAFGFDHGQLAAVELGRFGAVARCANLAAHTIAIARALIATLAIRTADLTFGAVAIVTALFFLRQLANVERPIARHATFAVGAIARRVTLGMAALKGANQR
jgi:hypothetical protein